MICYADGASKWMFDMSKDIIGILDLVYPGHPWAVHVYGDNKGGGYFIKHLDFPSTFGMNQPRAHLFASASELRNDVIMKGGELLERCGLARKWWDGQSIKMMEGVPFKHQPLEYRREETLKALALAFPEKQKEEETHDRLPET